MLENILLDQQKFFKSKIVAQNSNRWIFSEVWEYVENIGDVKMIYLRDSSYSENKVLRDYNIILIQKC